MPGVLTDEQVETVLLQLAKGQGEFSEDDAEKCLDWVNKTMIDKSLLEMVLNGRLVLSVQDGEVHFEHKD